MSQEAQIMEVLARIEDKVTSHGERLDAHDHILQTHSNQILEHGKILTEHARLHTDHARGLIAAAENARKARESASDLVKESREAFIAIGKHMDGVAATSTEKLDGLALQNNEAAEQRALQTAALQQLVQWKDKRWFRAVLLVGGFAGGAAAGFVMHLLAGGLLR